MPSQYSGNPIASQDPSPAPAFKTVPIGNLPVDGDTLNASSFLQAYKVCLDWIAFLAGNALPSLGVTTYDPTVTYTAGQIVYDTVTHRTYRVKAGYSPTAGTAPTNGTYWDVWGHSLLELVSDLAGIYPVHGNVSLGYYALFGGLTVQWETEDSPLGESGYPQTITHTFDRPFSNGCIAVIPIVQSRDHSARVSAASTTECTIVPFGGNPGGAQAWSVRIISIGY
jgi:hypothetical protein